MAQVSIPVSTTTFFSTPTGAIEETPKDPLGKIITLEEVSWHDNYDDCWVVIYDRVYDITDFFDEVIV